MITAYETINTGGRTLDDRRLHTLINDIKEYVSLPAFFVLRSIWTGTLQVWKVHSLQNKCIGKAGLVSLESGDLVHQAALALVLGGSRSLGNDE